MGSASVTSARVMFAEERFQGKVVPITKSATLVWPAGIQLIGPSKLGASLLLTLTKNAKMTTSAN